MDAAKKPEMSSSVSDGHHGVHPVLDSRHVWNSTGRADHCCHTIQSELLFSHVCQQNARWQTLSEQALISKPVQRLDSHYWPHWALANNECVIMNDWLKFFQFSVLLNSLRILLHLLTWRQLKFLKNLLILNCTWRWLRISYLIHTHTPYITEYSTYCMP